MQRVRTIRNSNHNPPGPDNTATIHLSGDTHYLQQQLDIRGTDSYLTIRNYREEKVTLTLTILQYLCSYVHNI